MNEKILINCLSINPYIGGEWAVGWNVVKYLGQFCDITVLYPKEQFENKEADIVNEINKNPNFYKSITFIPVDNTKTGKKLYEKSMGKTLAVNRLFLYGAFKEWMYSSYLYAKNNLDLTNYKLVHQLTMCGFREPGFMWKLDLPFYWGPIIGYWHIPFSYYFSIGIKELLLRFGQKQINFIQAHTGRVKKAGINSIHIWTNEEKILQNLINDYWKTNGSMVHEAGVKSELLKNADIRNYNKGETLKLISVSGHGSRRKGLFLIIKSISNIQNPIELTIIGEGSDTKYQKKLVKKLKIENKVKFLGKVNYSEIPEMLNDAHLFVHPSLIDAVSSSTCEAFASGLPVLCHDIYGLGYAVTDESGFKIKRINPKKSIIQFTEILNIIIENPKLIETKSKGALKRAEELTWEKLAEKIFLDYKLT